MTQKQGIIVGVGALAAVFLLKARSAGAAGKPGVAKPATVAPGHPSGSLRQPNSTNLATGYGNRTTAQVPSLAGFGANVLAPLAGIFGNFAKIFGAQQQQKGQPQQQQKSTAPTGGAPSGGGAVRPGAAPNSSPWDASGNYVGKSTYSADYDPSSYVGINPYTGLYDPTYDPSVTFNPESNSSPIDPSMLPGQTVVDENGQLYQDAPALGYDGGDDPLSYYADTSVPPEPAPWFPTLEPEVLPIDPSMFPGYDSPTDLVLSGDSFMGGGGDTSWDESSDAW